MNDDNLIMFVDDDPYISDLYASVFSRANLNYLVAHTGKEARSILTSRKPRLLLLDIMLPDTSGLDLLKEVKSNPQTSAVVVWMLSNLGDVSTQEKSRQLGAAEYIIKAQLTPNQVVDRIKAYLNI